MMQHQVNVSARFNPETLERVLRVVRHRGFHVCSMNMAGNRAGRTEHKYRIDRCQPTVGRLTV